VDQYGGAIFLILFIALTVWRMIRYMKAALARRPQSGVPGLGGPVMGVPASTATSNPESPIKDPAKSSALSRVIERMTTVLVFVAGNILIWGCLFGLPSLGELPAIWRLVVGVFANFALIRLARAIGTSVAKRVGRSPSAEGNNPLL